MKPPPFQYHDPKTLAEAVGLLGTLDNAKLLAGGQSLMPMLNMRFVLPDHVIDLNRVEGLAGIRDLGDVIEIGAMTRQRDIEFSEVIKAKCPLLHEAIQFTGHRQTRNRGTIGGSLCHLDPSAEQVTASVEAVLPSPTSLKVQTRLPLESTLAAARMKCGLSAKAAETLNASVSSAATSMALSLRYGRRMTRRMTRRMMCLSFDRFRTQRCFVRHLMRPCTTGLCTI